MPGVVVTAYDGPFCGAHGVGAPAIGLRVRFPSTSPVGGVERRQEVVTREDAEGTRDAGATVVARVAPAIVRAPLVPRLARVVQGHAPPIGRL